MAPTTEQALQQAMACHQAGQLQDAERLYRIVLRDQPNHPDANHNLGVLAMQVKQLAAALPHFKAAVDASPAHWQYWQSYASALLATGRAREALSVIENAMQRGFKTPEAQALRQKAESAARNDSTNSAGPTQAEIVQLVALFNAGSYLELESRARALVEQHPDSGPAWKVLAVSLSAQGKDAIFAMQKAAKLLPGDAEAHFNLGIALMGLGRSAEAVASYRRALEIKPDYAEAYNSLGNALNDLGQPAEAVASLRRALEIKADYAEAHNSLGNALKDLGRLDEAVASYGRALAIKPDFAEAHSNLGIALMDLGRSSEAAASLRRALSFKPNVAEVHNNLGKALEDFGQTEEAVANFRRALEIKPDYFGAHHNLGNALLNLRQFDEAVVSYRRALEIKPDFAEAHNGLGFALKGIGHLDAAVASYRRALEIKPDNDSAIHMIAAMTGSNAERAPDKYVAQLFDSYAERFDSHLVEKLEYRVPEKIVELIREASTPVAVKWDVLDLGCGTGLVGAAIAASVRQLVGVDLSQKMLEKARARKIYTRLENCELLEMVAGEAPASYDIVTAADVLVYIGRLDALFAGVKRILRADGLFGFTVEALDRLPGVQAADGTLRESWLLPTGRFAHSSAYLKRLAAEHGFKTHRFESTIGRIEAGVPVQSWMVLLKRGGGAA